MSPAVTVTHSCSFDFRLNILQNTRCFLDSLLRILLTDLLAACVSASQS